MQFRTLYISVLLLFIASTSLAQMPVIDSLKSVLANQQDDSLKYETLTKLFHEYRKVDRNAIVPIGHELLAIAKKLNDKKREARAHNLLGFSYLSLSKNDSVIYHSELSNRIAGEIGDSTFFISCLNNIALAHQRSNNYEEATTTYHQVIDGAVEKGDLRNAVIGLINIASIQMEQENYSAAVDYLDRVDEIYRSIDEEFMEQKLLKDIAEHQRRGSTSERLKSAKDSIRRVIDDLYPNVYINKGLCFVELDSLDLALVTFEKAIESCEKMEDSYIATYITAYANNSIGEIYQEYANVPSGPENFRENNWAIARGYYEKAYDGFDKIDFDRGRTFTLKAQGKMNTKLGNLDIGLSQLRESLILAEQLDFTEEKRDVYEGLSENARMRGNYEEALIHLEQFMNYKDSIRNEERDQAIQEFEVKYETSQKEKAIAELNFQNELKSRQQRMQLILFVVGTLMIIGISALLYFRSRYQQQKEAAEAERVLNVAMNRFVPNEFIRAIGRDHILDVKLGDQVEKEISVVFTDIRSFTTISESMAPKENFEFVRKYAERMGPIIQRNGGFVNQYLGDGIMAIFQNSPQDALNACIEMQKEIENFNAELKDYSWTPIRVGMGVHTGPLIMGIIGDDQRRDATLISDTVNTAARIESTTKQFGVKILISGDSKRKMQNSEKYYFRRIGDIHVKGKLVPVDIYECINADSAEQIDQKLKTSQLFKEAFEMMNSNSNQKASKKLQEILLKNPDDTVSKALLSMSESTLS
jgi:class 3 adenylate cyclase